MNILTFDLEEWFHLLDYRESSTLSSWENKEGRIENNTARILDKLGEHNLKATWFCLGWIALKYPSLVKRISENHEIACHSMDHALLYKKTRKEIEVDIRENINVLENLTGRKVVAYRAPGFSFTRETKWLPEVLSESGIIYDCSVFPMQRNHGGFAGFPCMEPCRIVSGETELKEFPMNGVAIGGKHIVFSGGGYFRLLPYQLIDYFMRKSGYVMTYFHPRDFDSSQQMLPNLSFKRKFMSYVGLKKSFSKFSRLLNDHTFISLEDAGRSIDWNNTPRINIDQY